MSAADAVRRAQVLGCGGPIRQRACHGAQAERHLLREAWRASRTPRCPAALVGESLRVPEGGPMGFEASWRQYYRHYDPGDRTRGSARRFSAASVTGASARHSPAKAARREIEKKRASRWHTWRARRPTPAWRNRDPRVPGRCFPSLACYIGPGRWFGGSAPSVFSGEIGFVFKQPSPEPPLSTGNDKSPLH
jgi:hypothetical protein